MRSVSSSAGDSGSGRGRANFLQRISSTLRDRSSRGYRKDEQSSGAQDQAQARCVMHTPPVLVPSANDRKGRKTLSCSYVQLKFAEVACGMS